jgi:hypothetical protein
VEARARGLVQDGSTAARRGLEPNQAPDLRPGNKPAVKKRAEKGSGASWGQEQGRGGQAAPH